MQNYEEFLRYDTFFDHNVGNNNKDMMPKLHSFRFTNKENKNNKVSRLMRHKKKFC